MQPTLRARARASIVLATPGTSSSRMCPSQKYAATASVSCGRLPMMTFSMLAMMRLAMPATSMWAWAKSVRCASGAVTIRVHGLDVPRRGDSGFCGCQTDGFPDSASPGVDSPGSGTISGRYRSSGEPMPLHLTEEQLNEPVTKHLRTDFTTLYPQWTVARHSTTCAATPARPDHLFYVVDERCGSVGVVPTRRLLARPRPTRRSRTS